jgi:FkbM family methyltransferase
VILKHTRICNHSLLPQLINRDSVVVDLGAYDGDFAGEILRRFDCRVIAAEPVREIFDRIQPHPRLEPLPLAVGGENRSTAVNVFANRCASVMPAADLADAAKEQPVEMVTLRELRRRASLNHIDLLKVDIEGAEIAMFDDCSDDELRSIDQITVEFHEHLFPEQQPAIQRICRRMESVGFWVLPFSLDATDVLFLNPATGVGSLEVAYLRSVVRYGRGIARRLRAGARSRRPALQPSR